MGRPKGSKNKPKTAKGNQDKTSTKARPASNYELRLRKPVEANGELNQNEKEIAQETETVLNTTTNQINENLVQDNNLQVNDNTENNDLNVNEIDENNNELNLTADTTIESVHQTAENKLDPINPLFTFVKIKQEYHIYRCNTRCLFTYLERNEDDDSEFKLQLKSFLLERSKHHLKEKYGNDQKDAMLIAAFLDPLCFTILNELEIEKAKKLILRNKIILSLMNLRFEIKK